MQKLLALGLFCTALAFGEATLVIPHIADGGGWKTSIALFNGFSGETVRVSIIFRSGDGLRAAFPINYFGTVSSLDLEMAAASSLYLETSGTRGDVQVGWVEVTQLNGTGPVRGFAVFRQTVPGRPDFEAVSLGARTAGSMTFPFDNTAGFATTFAVVNLAQSACGIAVITVFDEFGNSLSTEPKVVSGNVLGNGHSAFVLSDKFPDLANKRGFLTLRPFLSCASGGFAAVGLRFNSSGPFTTLMPLNVAAPDPR